MNNIPEGYKQTEVGVISEDWGVKELREIADVKTGPFGSSLHERDYVDDGTPIITVEHLSEYGVVHQNLPMVSDLDRKRLNAYALQPDDIVFSRVGSVDRNSLIKETENGWLFSGRLLRIRLNTKYIFPAYLSYYFHQEPTKQRIRSVAVGQTMASLNTEILKNIEVSIPPTIEEQNAIATVLSDVDALIEHLGELIAKKIAIKQGAMQQLLTGEKRLPGFEKKEGYKQTEVGVIPEDWEVCKLGEVAEKIVGGGTPSRSSPQYWNGDIPWVTVKDFTTFNPYCSQETITKEGLTCSASHLIPKGTLITSTRMALGKAVIYKVDVSINQDLKAFFTTKDVEVLFLYYWFQKKAEYIDMLGSGSTVKGISLTDLRNIAFLKPSKPEQTAIATILSEMDAEIESLEQKRDKYAMLKQGMMQELLTGKTRLLKEDKT